MKQQWQDFLDSQPIWSYNIVPSIVQQLDNAMQSQDDRATKSAVAALNTQGITLDNGELVYLQDLIFENICNQTDTITVREAAQKLDCSTANIYRLIKAEKLQVNNNAITARSVANYKQTKKVGRPLGSSRIKN